jgi:cell division septum initiation protein DivIVA
MTDKRKMRNAHMINSTFRHGMNNAEDQAKKDKWEENLRTQSVRLSPQPEHKAGKNNDGSHERPPPGGR